MTIQDEITVQTLKTVKQAQDITVGAINTVADRVAPLLPKTESVAFLQNVPTATELVEKAFDLGGVLLASARTIAVEATKAFSPRTAAKTAPKAATKPAAKANGTKPAAA